MCEIDSSISLKKLAVKPCLGVRSDLGGKLCRLAFWVQSKDASAPKNERALGPGSGMH